MFYTATPKKALSIDVYKEITISSSFIYVFKNAFLRDLLTVRKKNYINMFYIHTCLLGGGKKPHKTEKNEQQ